MTLPSTYAPAVSVIRDECVYLLLALEEEFERINPINDRTTYYWQPMKNYGRFIPPLKYDLTEQIDKNNGKENQRYGCDAVHWYIIRECIHNSHCSDLIGNDWETLSVIQGEPWSNQWLASTNLKCPSK